MSVTITQAFEHIAALPLAGKTETIPLEASLGRVLAQPVHATYQLPRFDNSAMDGYAVRMSDAGKTVTIADTLFAGHPSTTPVRDGSAIKIMTGAVVPEGTEAIIPIEHTTLVDPEHVTLPRTFTPHANIRFSGEDVAHELLLLGEGSLIKAGDMALLASQGMTHLTVYTIPSVTIFATGEELLPHYAKIASHQIYNSNSPMLLGQAREAGANVRFVEASRDCLEMIKTKIANALDTDLLITSGGASVGDADLTKMALTQMGMEEIFTKIEIKPGKPTSLGKIGRTWVLILPGNPLACFVNMALFGKALIRHLRGEALTPTVIPTSTTQAISTKGGIDTVILGTMDATGFTPLPKQGPNMVSPLSLATALTIIDRTTPHVAQGDTILVRTV